MRDRYANIYGPNDAVGWLVSLDVVLLIGRILLVILFIRAGFSKLTGLEGTATYINTKLAMGVTLAPIVGVLELVYRDPDCGRLPDAARRCGAVPFHRRRDADLPRLLEHDRRRRGRERDQLLQEPRDPRRAVDPRHRRPRPSLARQALARVVAGHEARRDRPQAVAVDPARAGDVAHGEIERIEPHVRGEALVPGGARF